MDQDRIQALIGLGARIVEQARARGADVAEVLARDSLELSAKVRLERPELIEEAGSLAIDAREATARAIRAEGAALALDPQIKNSEGATFQRVISAQALVTSGGFAGGYRATQHTIDVNPVADDQGGKKRQGHHWDAR